MHTRFKFKTALFFYNHTFFYSLHFMLTLYVVSFDENETKYQIIYSIDTYFNNFKAFKAEETM